MLNDHVDKVFVVNLLERWERMERTAAELSRHGVKYEPWAAIKKNNGEQGLRETMKHLFEHVLYKGYSRVCVFEDDIRILVESFKEQFDDCIANCPADFSLFYLGANLWHKPMRYRKNVLKVTGAYSTHAVIYSREAIEQILSFLHKEKAYDRILVDHIQPGLNCFCAYPLLITQYNGFSDIAKKEVDYQKFLEQRYWERTKDI
jgi:GR25 family glycosyltransferase involved in LPS biosynthesis